MEELVEEIKNGNKDLYVKVVEELKDYLHDVAVSYLTSEEFAEDAVQETFIQAYDKLEQLREPKYFKTWIIKILINECNNIYYYNLRQISLINRRKSTV